jgi:hypothetical protein
MREVRSGTPDDGGPNGSGTLAAARPTVGAVMKTRRSAPAPAGPTQATVDRGAPAWRALGATAETWRPSGVDDAWEVLDRIGRYCVYTCEPSGERCREAACEAWSLERHAADYLVGRWLDVQD